MKVHEVTSNETKKKKTLAHAGMTRMATSELITERGLQAVEMST
jgi:hypothetical protein